MVAARHFKSALIQISELSKNFLKNILKNQCNYALLRNCALHLSSLYSTTYFWECVFSNTDQI